MTNRYKTPRTNNCLKCYCVHVPGWVYAANFYGRNEREARDAMIKARESHND